MMKRIISVVLCLGMLAGALLFSSCGETEVSETTETLPATINLLGITEESTTPEAVEAVEEALNRISKTRYKTQINLTLVTADEYIALVDERFAEAEANTIRIEAITSFNDLAQREANESQSQSDQDLLFGKWTIHVNKVIAETISTGEVYTAEETTILEDGRIETLYPEAASPVDIIMIAGKDMYDYFDSKGYLLSVEDLLRTDFTKFRQYIYPTFLESLKAVTGDVKAIPNNNLLSEYTYLVVDKTLADKYNFDVDAVDSYDDLDAGDAGFLTQIKENEDVIPMATVPDALGIYQYFDDGIAVGTYFDPIYGYDTNEGTDFTIQNLFSIPQYREHLILMEEYEEKGYFSASSDTDEYAVTVVKGDASVPDLYGDDYYVKVLQNPFVEVDSIFEGMFAVSSYTSDEKRALQVLEMINTDSEVKNLLQYGIAYDGDNDDVANYQVNTIENEDGSFSYSITRLNHNYMMNNALTGNVYMGYPEEGQNVDAWTYYKETNLASALSPFLTFYLSDSDLDGMFDDIIRRACMMEVLAPLGYDYDEYEDSNGTNTGSTMRSAFKRYYIVEFIEYLSQEGLTANTFRYVTRDSVSELEADFLEFILSAEGQAILKENGYTVDTDAEHYVQKDTPFTGTLDMCANMSNYERGYFEGAIEDLVAAYQEMYPDVVMNVPQRDQNSNYAMSMTRVADGTYDIAFMGSALSDVDAARGLTSTEIAVEYLEVFDSMTNMAYPISWYENKMIEKITAEKYSDIVSQSGLDLLISNKLGELAGIDLSRYSESSRPASETVVFENAKASADQYYSNISYLRVMAEILLWDELPESELERYRALSEVDFETAVFNYVRANYEKENNLTDEDYANLVHEFMASVLSFSGSDNSTYTVSREEFLQAKESAQPYLTAAETIRDIYYDRLVAKLGSGYLNLLSLPETIDEIYEIAYEEYLTSNGLDKTEYENALMDQILDAVGTTNAEFSALSKSSDEYDNILAALRKEYKNILIDTYSKEAYDSANGIKNDEVIDAIFNYYLEDELHIYDQLCALANISYEDFSAAEESMENYEMYLNRMQTSFIYTLRTQYTQSQIDSWSYEEMETNLYNLLYNTGFYTNEMARYIGYSLSDYMLAKSDAVTYQNYIRTAANALSAELGELGYEVSEFVKLDRDTMETILKDIIEEKYFSEKVLLEDVLADLSAEWMDGLDSADDMATYLDEASNALSSDYFFMAVVGTLEASWNESKTAE